MANAQPAAYLSGHNPAGDVSFAVYGNHVHVFGYAYDIDSWEPVNVVYYVNGAPRAEQRTDYGYIERTFRLPYGTTELRVVARNIGLGASDTVIGSRVFQLFDPATRNPRGFARITHYHRRLHVRGFTVDPDRLTWPLLVRVFDNGRLIAATRADPSTHLYTMTARPAPPKPAPPKPAPPRPSPPSGSGAAWTLQYYGYQRTAARMFTAYGWGARQMPFLVKLWNRESGWNPRALNRSSGAYGIPQSLPASKMATAGADWRTNATTQIRWGLRYIKNRYGSPERAWAHEGRYNWY